MLTVMQEHNAHPAITRCSFLCPLSFADSEVYLQTSPLHHCWKEIPNQAHLFVLCCKCVIAFGYKQYYDLTLMNASLNVPIRNVWTKIGWVMRSTQIPVAFNIHFSEKKKLGVHWVLTPFIPSSSTTISTLLQHKPLWLLYCLTGHA